MGQAGKGKQADKANSKHQAETAKKQQSTYSSIASSICLLCTFCILVVSLGFGFSKTVENPALMQTAASMAPMMMASDSRLKKSVKNVKYGMKELLQLEPKSYHYINENEETTRHIGLMAQDVAKIIPEAVVEFDNQKVNTIRNMLPSDTTDSTLYGLKYQELVPVLINAIKELKNEIDTLKQHVFI